MAHTYSVQCEPAPLNSAAEHGRVTTASERAFDAGADWSGEDITLVPAKNKATLMASLPAEPAT